MEVRPAIANPMRSATSARPGTLEIRVPTRMRKVPQQERSQQMVTAIRQAAVLSFEEASGAAAASMQTIAFRAGASLGSIYQYYANLESVLAAVYEDVITGVLRIHGRRGLRIADLRTKLTHAVAALDALFQSNLGESSYKPLIYAMGSSDQLSGIIKHRFKPFDASLHYADVWLRVIK